MEIDAARVKKKPSRLAKLFQKALEKIGYFPFARGGTVAAPVDPRFHRPRPKPLPRPAADATEASAAAIAALRAIPGLPRAAAHVHHEELEAALRDSQRELQELQQTLERELLAPATALSPLPSDGYSVSYRITENVSVVSSIPRFSQLSYFLRDGIMTAEEVPERQGFSVRWIDPDPESVRSQAADAIIEAMRARASMPTPPLLPPPPPYVEKPDLDGKREIRLEEEEQS